MRTDTTVAESGPVGDMRSGSAARYISPRRASFERTLATTLYRLVLTLILLFLLIPIVVVVLASFSRTQLLEFPPTGFSMQWWDTALTSTWLDPIFFSLRLGVIVSLLATILGTLAAFGINRGRFRGRELLNTILLSPLLIPQIIIGVALLQFFSELELRGMIGLAGIIVGHVVITIPYVTRTVLVSLTGFDQRLEWAARDLGANTLQTFWHVTLPMVKNGVFAGAVIAFIISFNDVPISLFLSRPGQVPIPIAILNYMEFQFDPALAAVAVITIVIVIVLIGIGQRFARVSEFVHQQD